MLVLNAKTLESELKRNGLLMVEFYAPWCVFPVGDGVAVRRSPWVFFGATSPLAACCFRSATAARGEGDSRGASPGRPARLSPTELLGMARPVASMCAREVLADGWSSEVLGDSWCCVLLVRARWG